MPGRFLRFERFWQVLRGFGNPSIPAYLGHGIYRRGYMNKYSGREARIFIHISGATYLNLGAWDEIASEKTQTFKKKRAVFSEALPPFFLKLCAVFSEALRRPRHDHHHHHLHRRLGRQHRRLCFYIKKAPLSEMSAGAERSPHT